jgi:hypothetical protein
LAADSWTSNNSEVVGILMDATTYRDGSAFLPNVNHAKNPKQIKFLNPQMVDTASEPDLPGVGSDMIYRDPWGQPYIISLDLNYDEKCWDALYRNTPVSQQSGNAGYNGLSSFPPASNPTAPNCFAFNGGVMVWSLGPDKKAELGSPSPNATEKPNRDNICSWK